MSFVRLLHLSDRVTEWTLAIALSLAIDAAVSMIMLYAGKWSPTLGLAAIIVLSAVGVGYQLSDNKSKGAIIREH